MATIKSSLDTDYRGCFCPADGRMYFTNDHAKVVVWNPPNSTAEDAGITGPAAAIGTPTQAAGSATTAGDHLVRYRYKNSRTGYVSNPSDAITVTVTATGTDGQLTFTITDSGGGGDIIRSTDTKVDTILVEMTSAGGTVYYTAKEVLQTATSAVVDIKDTSLIQQLSIQTTYGAFGHEPPPLCAGLVEHNGRLFAIGATKRTRTSVTATNASTTVTGTNFSTNWAGRLVRFDSETTVYEIASVASATSLTLTVAYAGSTGSSKSMLVYSKHPNRIAWSAPGLPESFKPTGNARDMLLGKSDLVSGWASWAGDLWVFGQNSAERLNYTIDPGKGQRVPVKTELGVWNHFCIAEAAGKLYGFGRGGVWVLEGGIPVHISAPIDETVESLIDKSQYEEFHGCYDPRERVVRFWFNKTDDTKPKHAIVYEVETGQWWIDQWRQGITSSALVADADGNLRCLVGDENGYSWFLAEDGPDGVAADNPRAVTSTANSTTTVVEVDETLTSATASLAGAYLYDPIQDEARLISSHTTSSPYRITVSSAFTAAPPDNRVLYLGSFTWSMKTKWFVGKGLQTKKHPIYLYIHLVNSSNTSATGTVKYYQDFSSTAWTANRDMSSDTFDDGVTGPTSGASTFTFYLAGGSTGTDGHIAIPVPGDWKRCIQAELTVTDPRGEVRILDVGFRIKGETEKANG